MKGLKHIALIPAVLFGLTVPAMASETIAKESVSACAAISSPLERLQCYDKLAKANGIAVGLSEKVGGWKTGVDEDPLTDSKIYTAILHTKEDTAPNYKTIYLGVRCVSEATDVLIVWDTVVGTGEQAMVTTRIGKESPKVELWNRSSSGTATFMPDPVNTMKRIIESGAFVAKIEPRHQSPITAVFDTTGAQEALADIRKACNWQ
ncbi:type VI secretion system-associated protein TagO [Vandammella animalimorsus]|uniref:type VI secretion system-associated protein TagO n=1 Tax=Vandammella animalimorsus TaxID=2029117 RepID=UPI0031BB9328